MGGAEKHLIVSAPSGYGKTHLINHIIANIPMYTTRAKVLGETFPSQLQFAAPTNKAASLGHSGNTIHKALKLRLEKNCVTGETKTIQATPTRLSNLVVDEWSMVSKDILPFVSKSVTKTIWLGDGYQLPPVGDKISPVSQLPAIRVTLDTPQRQHSDSGLFKMCQHLRSMVQQKKMIKTVLNDDCIYLNQSAMESMSMSHFGNADNNRIITFTNNKAIAINSYIRKIHGFKDYWSVGESVIAKNFAFSQCKLSATSAELDCIVDDVDEDNERVSIDGSWFHVAKDPAQVHRAISKAKRDKDFRRSFEIQETWLDLRSAYTGTCHSMQGSTYDNVFIDLSDFSKCSDLNTLTRLLYVAVSRAKHKVYFYGKPSFDLF